VNNPGIIIGRKGTIGTVYYSDQPFFCIDTAYYIEPDETKYKIKFLYYLLKTIGLKELNEDSAVPGLNRDTAYAQEILLPPLPEQQSIAAILSSFDDKIDLLHRQNKTLEAMAETLFRQWFMEEVDESWEIGKLGDAIELIYGKGLKEEIRTGTGFPVIGSNGIVGFHSEFLVEGPGIVIGRKGTLGRVVYLFENFYPIDTTYFVKSKLGSDGLFYEYFLLKTMNFEDMNTDSAVPGLNREIALSVEIKIPPLQRLYDFNRFCILLFDKLKKNDGQTNLEVSVN
ncbi:MAG: restriction endonuclease subunit S, partial [Proteobacteria bacterium]|nr:restriction endonuclease subunit S [Pseudomonadota bacterium]